MRQVLIPIYKFEELKPEIQSKVISNFREGLEYPLLDDLLNEKLLEMLSQFGWNGDKSNYEIYYDLSYSQGSGFCFTGDFQSEGCDIYIKKKTFHYNHHNTVSIDTYDVTGNETNDEFNKKIREEYDKICFECEKIGYAYIGEEDEEEHIKEQLKEFEFYGDGRIY